MASHFRALAIPAAFGMLFATLYNVVDVYFAGLLSTDAQAGLAIGYQAFFVLMAVGFGLGSALSALISNAKGSKDESQTQIFIAQGLTFGVIATVVSMAVGWILGPHLIALVSEPGAYRDAATGYFRWLIVALPGFFMAYGGNGVLQAHGDSRSMQRALMVAFFANIALNPLFIFGIPGVWDGMGFNGIAVATIISQTGVMFFIVSRIMRLAVMQSVALSAFRPVRTCFAQITAQLIPASSAMMVMFVSGFVVQFALKEFGAHAVAGYGVALRIEQILLLPVLGMTGALLPIAGQNFGAAQYGRVRAALRFCWMTGFAMTVVATPTLFFGGSFAMSVFTVDPDVIRVGASYLAVDAFLFPVYMMLFSINSLLQALKKPIWTLWISIYRQGFGVAFFVWVFIGLLDFTVWGVWLGIAAAVTSGWVLSLCVAQSVARKAIGGLLKAA
jgi:putative MATE family efflux protein